LNDEFDAGLRQIACFKQRFPAGRVVVLADQNQLTRMVSAFRAGANAYLVKVTTCEAFVKSLELVMLGMALLPPQILNLVSDRQGRNRNDRATEPSGDGHTAVDSVGKDEVVGADVGGRTSTAGADSSQTPRLSVCQQAILRCLTEGDSNKTVARKMAMAEATVKVHVKAILRKIQVRNRTQAAIWAMSNEPLVLAKDDAPLASEGLALEVFPNLNIAHVGSGRNGSIPLAAIKLKLPTSSRS